MADKKDKDLGEVFPEQSDEALKKELEELKETFQQELDKAAAEASTENAKTEEPDVNEEEEELSEDMLCECCGENKRGTKNNPDSPFCPDCDKALRRYPFDFLNIIIMIIVIGFSFYACYVFAGNANVYVDALNAQKAEKENMLYTANSDYSTLLETMNDKSIRGEMVYKRAILNLSKIGGYQDMEEYTESFKTWELSLPHFKSVANAFEEKNAFERTRDTCYEIIYSNIPEDAMEPSEVPYDTIITQLEALESQSLEPVTYSEEDVSDGLVTTTAAYSIEADAYSKAMISYFKFYTAAISEQPAETQIGFLEEIKNDYPEMTWLYGPMLGDLYVKAQKDVTDYCAFLKEVNSEDSYADVAMATSLRIQGNYEDSLLLCKQKVSENDDYTFEYYRQSALSCLALGEYDTACTAAKSAYDEYNYSIQVLDTLALCYAAAGNEDGYSEVEQIFAQSGMTVSDEVKDYKDGKITLDNIIKEGDFDVE